VFTGSMRIKIYTHPTTFMCISSSKLTENPLRSQIGDPSERIDLFIMLCVNVVRSVQIKRPQECGHILFVLNYELLHNYYF
jgi:hypothetical protein